MKYDPKFPYRINGGQVNADSVGVGIPMPGDDTAMEVTCTTDGLVLEIDGESVNVHPTILRQFFYKETLQ